MSGRRRRRSDDEEEDWDASSRQKRAATGFCNTRERRERRSTRVGDSSLSHQEDLVEEVGFDEEAEVREIRTEREVISTSRRGQGSGSRRGRREVRTQMGRLDFMMEGDDEDPQASIPARPLFSRSLRGYELVSDDYFVIFQWMRSWP